MNYRIIAAAACLAVAGCDDNPLARPPPRRQNESNSGETVNAPPAAESGVRHDDRNEESRISAAQRCARDNPGWLTATADYTTSGPFDWAPACFR